MSRNLKIGIVGMILGINMKLEKRTALLTIGWSHRSRHNALVCVVGLA